MGEMIVKSVAENIYVMTAREERFKEMVKEIPKRYENAEMYSVSVIMKRPDWIHNKSIMDFKLDGERFHGQYLMGWFMDKDNVDALADFATDFVNKYIAIPKEERDMNEYFSDAQSDWVLDHFFEAAGIDVSEDKE